MTHTICGSKNEEQEACLEPEHSQLHAGEEDPSPAEALCLNVCVCKDSLQEEGFHSSAV